MLFSPSLGLPRGFPTKITHILPVSPVLSTRPARKNFAELTNLTKLCDLWKSRSSSLLVCNILNCLHNKYFRFLGYN
jgi:hypothetical protein